MSEARKIVFVGPTLAQTDRPDVGVEYHPPVKHGSLFSLSLKRGDTVLIVDGIYQHFAPLKHKEILSHIDKGVKVLGAGSFGALRAAELHSCGMVGVGRVADGYIKQDLVDDSEVAVLHLPDKYSTRVTIPLVSIKYGLIDLLESKELDDGEADRILDISVGLHFTQRTRNKIEQLALVNAVLKPTKKLLDYIDSKGDVKRQDAIKAIQLMVSDKCSGENKALNRQKWQNSYGKSWEFEFSRVLKDHQPTAQQVLYCLQLFASDFPMRHKTYVERVIRNTHNSLSIFDEQQREEILQRVGLPQHRMKASRFAMPTRPSEQWPSETRVIVRTFRLPPGKYVYLSLPPEALGGRNSLAAVESCSALLLKSGAEKVDNRMWRRFLNEIWQSGSEIEFEMCAMERGFVDIDAVMKAARLFNFKLAESLFYGSSH